MSEITQGQFFEAVQQLRNLIEEKHSSQRHFVAQRFDVLDAKLDHHAMEDRAVEKRVTIIETERSGEKAQSVKRAGILGLTVAFLTTGLWKLLDHFWK